jgi:hypothetical protein
MTTETMRAGAGRAVIEFPAELFPTEGFIGVHDELHVRVLLLENENKVALVSIELTSISGEFVAALQKMLGEVTGFLPENILICATHTFSAPHFLPVHLIKSPADKQKNDLLFQAIQTAAIKATSMAVSGMKSARFGCETGVCDVNVNRDVLTADGWWLGSNETGPSDKTVTVLRFETLEGTPIAILFNYGVQPSVMDGSQLTSGGRLVSADLTGAASRFVEQAYGDAITSLFFLGAAGDQAPSLKAKYQYIGSDGHIHAEDIHEQGFIIAEMLGKRLGIEVLHVAESISCQSGSEPISIKNLTVKCPGQKMNMDIKSLHPTKQYIFVPAEERVEPVVIIRMGDVALVGVRPELSCCMASSIRKRSPFPKTIFMTMVNGGAKYMPDRSAYDRITYESMNSPFARGSAEILTRAVLKQLRVYRQE